MTDIISYKGKNLATLKLAERKEKPYKMILTVDCISDLTTLLGIGPEETVELSGSPRPYKELKEKYLGKLSEVYIGEAWAKKMSEEVERADQDKQACERIMNLERCLSEATTSPRDRLDNPNWLEDHK